MEIVEIRSRDGRVLVTAERPRGPRARVRGLIGRDSLPPGSGLLIKTKQVHTFGMAFAIDAVYMTRSGKVLSITTLPPGHFGPLHPRAKWILELAAGEAARVGIRVGEPLELGRSLPVDEPSPSETGKQA